MGGTEAEGQSQLVLGRGLRANSTVTATRDRSAGIYISGAGRVARLVEIG